MVTKLSECSIVQIVMVIGIQKNIQFIKKKLETLKSGHAPSNSLNNKLKGPVLRAGSRLRANKVTLLTFQCCNVIVFLKNCSFQPSAGG